MKSIVFVRAAPAASPAPELVETHSWISVPGECENERNYIEAANNILKGRLTIFRMEVDAYDVVKNWNRDPKTRISAP